MDSLEGIKLEPPSEEIFGFYRTAEGRAFLRRVYPHFRDRTGFRDWKIATLIADNNPNDQEREIDATKSALTRWHTSQANLWKEAAKSSRQMERLERHMMMTPAIAQVLEDQAQSIFKNDIGNSLAILYYGVVRSQDHRRDRDALLDSFSGFYESIFSDLTHKNSKRVITYLSRPAGCPFLIVQTIELPRWRAKSGKMFRRIEHGFAYPDSFRRLHQHVVVEENPRERRYYVHSPAAPDPRVYLPEIVDPSTERLFTALRSQTASLGGLFEGHMDEDDPHYDGSIWLILKQLFEPELSFIKNTLDRQMWNMAL